MNIFLRIKHWQLFLLSWGPLSLVFILLYTQPMVFANYFQLWLIIFSISVMNSFVWVWAVGRELQKRTLETHSKLFKIAFWIPFIYIWAFISFMLFNFFVRKVKSINFEIEMMVFIAIGVLSIICIIYGLVLIGRLLRTVELEKRPAWKDHILESVLMLFPPVGLWIVQPKLNKIIAGRKQ